MKATPNVKILVLSHPLGDLGVTHRIHLSLDGKRVVDFLLAIIELFSLALKAAALLSNISRCFYYSFLPLLVLIWLRQNLSTEVLMQSLGKIGRIASADVVMHLIKSKCVPILLYAVEACPVNRSLEKSLQFSVTRILMKIFKTRSSDIVMECQNYFGFLHHSYFD